MFELAYACGLRAEEIVSLRARGRRPRRRAAARGGQGPQDALRAGRRAGDGGAARVPASAARAGARGGRRRPREPGADARCSSARAAGALGTSDVRRRLRTWTARTGAGGGELAARAAAQLRHAPARRRSGPAQHPGAAGPRERVQHPDLHSGRVRATQTAPMRAVTLGPEPGEEPWRRTSNRSSCANSGGATRRTATRACASGSSSPTRRWSSTWPGAPPPGCRRTSRRPT